MQSPRRQGDGVHQKEGQLSLVNTPRTPCSALGVAQKRVCGVASASCMLMARLPNFADTQVAVANHPSGPDRLSTGRLLTSSWTEFSSTDNHDTNTRSNMSLRSSRFLGPHAASFGSWINVSLDTYAYRGFRSGTSWYSTLPFFHSLQLFSVQPDGFPTCHVTTKLVDLSRRAFECLRPFCFSCPITSSEHSRFQQSKCGLPGS